MVLLPGAWCFKVSAGTGWSGVSILLLGEIASWMIIIIIAIVIIIIIIIIIIHLIYIAQFDTNGILTALYKVIKYIQMQYVHI